MMTGTLIGCPRCLNMALLGSSSSQAMTRLASSLILSKGLFHRSIVLLFPLGVEHLAKMGKR